MPRKSDPYAPPPRHRDGSGAVVRFAVIAALLAGAWWGYNEYWGQDTRTAAVDFGVEEQTLANSDYEEAFETSEPAAESPEATTPAEPGELAAEPPG